MITDLDIGWTAGIVDGEGSIGVYDTYRKGRSTRLWTVRVMVVNTDVRIIHRFHHLWGGHFHMSARAGMTKDERRKKDLWRWQVSGKEACRFLRRIRGSLVSKGEQADLLLEFGKLLMHTRSGTPIPEENIHQREVLAAQLKLAKVG